jgi:uncharacterized protein YqgC (DUF456 family)
VEEPQNPYSPPKSEIVHSPEELGPGVMRVFSPAQGSLGTFVGGPLAGTYFIRSNFLALGDSKRARLTTIWGVVICAGILLALPFLPEKMPGYIIPMAYAITTRVIIERAQFTKAQIATSSTLAFHSGWRALGVAVVGLVIFALLGIAEFLLFPALLGS